MLERCEAAETAFKGFVPADAVAKSRASEAFGDEAVIAFETSPVAVGRVATVLFAGEVTAFPELSRTVTMWTLATVLVIVVVTSLVVSGLGEIGDAIPIVEGVTDVARLGIGETMTRYVSFYRWPLTWRPHRMHLPVVACPVISEAVTTGLLPLIQEIELWTSTK